MRHQRYSLKSHYYLLGCFFPEVITAKKSICLVKAQHCFLKFKYLSIKNCRYCTFSFPVTLHSWVFFHHSSASCSLLTLHSHHTAFGKGQNPQKGGFSPLFFSNIFSRALKTPPSYTEGSWMQLKCPKGAPASSGVNN